MNIPENITKEHLIKAIEKIDKEGIPTNGESQYYDAVFNGKIYPPKMIVSYANFFANGKILDRKTFTGGINTPCFKLLEKNDIEIREKFKSFYSELQKFIDQSETGNLKTKHYLKEYKQVKVKVSFGQGSSAKIPWISFLLPPNTTQNGIYPGYLYYKDKNLLILTYGVSETNKPKTDWNFSNKMKTVNEYFKDKNYGKPDRYGDSYISKVYDTKNLPTNEIIDQDLNKIIDEYKTLLLQKPSFKENMPKINFDSNTFKKNSEEAGLIFSEKLIHRFVASLCTKPFVLLTGLSGSGKTKLAQAFAKWICINEDQYCLVPVGADWTTKEPLLGYPNALDSNEYVQPENGVLNLIILANENKNLPYFLILDEMNLSHVERYFAEFLSAMESKEAISLHNGTENIEKIPSKIALPSNLFLIGTVNIDETTYMFSPKVLDRANTIEFRVTADEIATFLTSNKPLDLSLLSGNGIDMAESFLNISENKNFEPFPEVLNVTLLKFFKELKKTGAEFGYRSASEIQRLVNQLSIINRNLSQNEKLDIAIMQKLLPKLHGSRRKLCPVLVTLGKFCLADQEIKIEKEVFEKVEFDFSLPEKVKYPLSLEKITRMYKGAIDNGFASYAEA
jgi:5-methylcytosine-specific restriction protein B